MIRYIVTVMLMVTVLIIIFTLTSSLLSILFSVNSISHYSAVIMNDINRLLSIP
ncbi:MAG: hypothetical protein TU36_002635 [Vulcanisaeta sp. AZ3]